MPDGSQTSLEASSEISQLQETPEQQISRQLASQFHEEWRQTRFNKESGLFEPRIKSTKDEAWKVKHGTDQVDIANTTYDELPEDWKGENKAAAEVVINGISEASETGQDLSNPQTIEMLSEKVHQAWLERNGDWAPAEQKLPYEQLSEEEKAKDRDQVLKGLQLYSSIQPQS